MQDYERKLLEATLSNLATSMANGLREGFETEDIIEDRNTLTDYGEMWVQGYLVGRLTLIRGCSVGNPNVASGDIAEVKKLVTEHEARIAGGVYS